MIPEMMSSESEDEDGNFKVLQLSWRPKVISDALHLLDPVDAMNSSFKRKTRKYVSKESHHQPNKALLSGILKND